MNIIIRKASIRSSLFLNYEFEQKDIDQNNLNKVSSDAPIHDDLRACFRKLIPHFAFLCEQVTDEALVQSALERPESYLEDREHSVTEEFFKFYVGSVDIMEKKGLNYVTLSGNRLLESGDPLSLTAPSVDMEGTKYKFISQFIEDIDHLKREVLAYMEGKHAERAQLQMFNEEEEEEEQETPEPKAKEPKAKKNNSAFAD